MSLIAPTLESFFTDRLVKQQHASPATIGSYRDSLRMLLTYAQEHTGKTPARLDWADLDETLIGGFLDSLETERHNSPRTRNLRLTAIRSLVSYSSLQHPEHAATFQRVLAIPPKRFERALVSFLTAEEIDALVDAPDLDRWEGRRDRSLLLVAVRTGLRVSELTGLNCDNVTLGTGASVHCENGKGRKQRAVPLNTGTAATLAGWMAERGGQPGEPLFPTRTGRPLSSDAVQRLVRKHADVAADRCPSLRNKRLHPHALRHSCAMALLQAGVDTAVIALWLGHADLRSTNVYLQADMTTKQRALELTKPDSTPPGRYQPPDAVLAFLESL
ncbi:MAG: tyrosine-type recombinase/integrase [Candidatus Microthrix parvicella]|jgi:site-specific recombinase XerD|uniref:Tyrosine-type recombinase/integrase n=4 Tax=Candidatus Neomicrothrix TaxID=41949 RepID=A0A936TFF8_9ACTN|nr:MULTISPECIES: tyrosine-type recombinase/integrase [Microthrix]MBK9296550.1 tyrosine-type recombinase/integrase [Candidatus Microthrix subdominans]CCM64819.1 putative integrase/recombinase y4rC [Candidatus Microthrix parvicella RN1]